MQNKLNKVWEKILASVLVIALTAGNLMLIGSSMTSYAEANLENQNEKTAHANVEFGAYFESEGNKVHSLVRSAETKEKLYIHLNVKEAGYLKNGKIKIVDANYNITGEIEKSEIIAKLEENILDLKQINFGTEAVLEVPIALQMNERFDIENINKNSRVILTGTYVTLEGEEVAIEKEVNLNIAWDGITEIKLTSNLNTYKKYETEENKGIILQEKIVVEAVKASLPIQNTKIEVTVPTYMNEKPELVRVNSGRTEMTNGKEYDDVEFNWNYNKETGKVFIEVQNAKESGTVWAKAIGKDEFVITYEYGKTTYQAEMTQTNITRRAKAVVTTYSHSENNTVEKTLETTDTLTQEIGNVLSGEIEILKEINKAKIYANYNSNNREYETEYSTKEVISIAKSDIVTDIVIKGETESFLRAGQEEKNLVVENVDYSYYKSTKIAEENFNAILGNAGSILIEDENGEIGKIDATMEAVDGYYVLTYEDKPENIVIKTSGPITEGDLILEHEKAIKADLAYSKEDVKAFSEIKVTKQIGQNLGEFQTIEGRQTLTEAVSHLNLLSNKDTINQAEEAIELKLEFGNDEENSILYSNPTVKITLPKFIKIEEDVEKISAEVLFDEELDVGEKTIITGENGEKTIQIKLNGAQTRFNTIANANGATLVIGTNIICEEAGEGEIIAELDGNIARAKITSNLKTESKTEQEVEINNSISDTNQEQEDEKVEEQAKISVSMRSPMENVTLEEGMQVSYIINVNNTYFNNENEYVVKTDDATIKNIIVKDFLPEEVTFKEAVFRKFNDENNDYEEIENGVTYDAKNRVVTWNVGDMLLLSEAEVQLILRVTVNQLDEDVYEKEITNKAIASYEGMENITSNSSKIYVAKPQINVTKLTENILSVNKPQDSIKLIVRAENVGKVEDDAKIIVNLPEGINPLSIKFGKNNETINRTNTSKQIELEKVTLAPEDIYECEVSATIDDIEKDYTEQYKVLTPTASVNDQEINWIIKVENPNYTASTPNEPNQPDVPDNPGLPDVPNTPDEPSKQESYTISGNAWLDENKNGVKEEKEQKLKDIKVSVISNNNTLKETTTDVNGMYSFEGLEKGNYQIVFNYNGETYKVAEYRKTGELEINSSAIAGAKGEAITDIVKVVDKDVVHVNLGLVKIPEFDMSLSKKVSRIIIQNKEGTKEHNYDSELAKAEINAKYLNGSVVLVEYKITIKNEGELAGRVKKIVDYMPKDMIFSTDVNRTWIQGADGNLYNSELKDIDIEPGETKEITLILKKKMTEENTGIINNTAEIAEVENSENIKDKDSTPTNKVQGEDDMSSADVLLGVRTGAEVLYITLAIVILIMLATGMYLINIKVLKE